jgi:hypothetical protein
MDREKIASLIVPRNCQRRVGQGHLQFGGKDFFGYCQSLFHAAAGCCCDSIAVATKYRIWADTLLCCACATRSTAARSSGSSFTLICSFDRSFIGLVLQITPITNMQNVTGHRNAPSSSDHTADPEAPKNQQRWFEIKKKIGTG